jgi:glycosyltransferase involved in cell wall biosynthesis
MGPIYFWQRIVSPHMAGLAAALAGQDCSVVYVAERQMSEDRAQQGWTSPDLGKARLELAPTTAAVQTLALSAQVDAVHICQGIRSNGLVGVAQRTLAAHHRKQWVVMETVEDAGWRGVLKRLEYRRLFLRWRSRIQGVLATGCHTPSWVVRRGIPADRVFPFAYFLLDAIRPESERLVEPAGPFRFVFVGQFIERKRLDLLLSALAILERDDVELVVVGSGPLERELQSFAEKTWPGHVRWLGRLPLGEVPQAMARADCLVLPSRHDGWGAVVSEALMVGTPAICSDACGAAEVVRASGAGGVFRSGDLASLVQTLDAALTAGKPQEQDRRTLASWARCLGASAGAGYLRAIEQHSRDVGPRPTPPWERSSQLIPNF